MRKIFALILALVLTLGAGTAAMAAWVDSGTGSATAAAGNLAQGTTPVIESFTRVETASTAEVGLRWGNTSGAENYEVRRLASSGGAVQSIGTDCDILVPGTDSEDATCTEQQVPEGRWRYEQRPRIGASWVGAWSTASGEVAVAPGTPSNFRVVATSSTQLDLSWTDNSTTGDVFLLERWDTGTSQWAQIADDLTNPGYADSGLECGQNYSYLVRARSTEHVLTSAYSEIASGTTVSCGPSPTSFSVVEISDASDRAGGGGNWKPGVKVRVEDNLGNPVQNATIAGDLQGVETGLSCVTDVFGECPLIKSGGNTKTTPVTFHVTGTSHGTLTSAAGLTTLILHYSQ